VDLVKILAAIPARAVSPATPSCLLPARALTLVDGRPVLALIKERLAKSQSLDQMVVTLGDPKEDAQIADLSQELGFEVLFGHPDDVLARLHMATELFEADHVVRINGNFPLIDPKAVDDLVSAHLTHHADISLNSHYHGLVYGLGAEIFSTTGLARAMAEPKNRRPLDAGATFMLQNPEKYGIFLQPTQRTAPYYRVSVDFAPDITVVSEIIRHVPDPDNESIIDFLDQRPDLTALQQTPAPAEVSLEKAMLFPEKMQALRRNNCITFDTSYPISVELSLTNRCNHACVWCSDAAIRRRLPGELDMDSLISLFEELKAGGTRGIVIEGGGEPTMHPRFAEVVENISGLNMAQGLITNGYNLPLDVIHHFEWVRFSLDAASSSQYKALKGVDGFDRVIHNLQAAAQQTSTLGVGYVVTNRNDDAVLLEQLVLFLRSIGVAYIQFRPVVDHPELSSSIDLGFLKKHETSDFSVNLSAMTDNIETGNSNLPCLAHSLSTVICADGSVFLCGRLNTLDSWSPIGSLSDTTFHQIWTGRTRKQQVSLVSRADFCRQHCPQCRMTKYNRLLNDVERIKTRNFI
jgi:spore coat polysaccharide biosynthesis protein SpsF (cytidylyltransferase family)/MoaA/NifB/PqqE/SkfB family radical SAM enzyme